jgi:hypothetical protein
MNVNQEMVDRFRRVETKVTKIAHHLGVDAGVEIPTWTRGRITVTSIKCSVQEMLSVVPQDWDTDDEIGVYAKGGEFLFTLFLPEKLRQTA